MAIDARKSMPWSRRRALAAATSALAAMALAASMAGRGCRMNEDDASGAVHAFIAAASAEDHEALFELLGPETRAGLDQAARRATDLAGGAHRFDAIDMLSIGKASASSRELRVLEHGDDRAVIEIVSDSGERARLVAVHVEGAWRVELPEYAPPAPPEPRKSP
jgi:cytochrome c551/c552